MQACCYILYSSRIDRFYIGSTHDSIEIRLEKHNSGFYEDKWTAHGTPWEIFFMTECESVTQALHIEKHIKHMKSKKYIRNLRYHPEIIDRLKIKYSV